MAATTPVTTSTHLPIDLVRDILSRLPSKSLLRFRCVCKSWRDLIYDSKFIELHRNVNNIDHILTILRVKRFVRRELIYSLPCDNTTMEHTQLELPFLNFFKFPRQELIVSGCSNGLVLICLYNYAKPRPRIGVIILWNPSIRKWKVVSTEEVFPPILVFGFVPKINDYKVLSLKCCHNDTYQAEIYSLSTKSWKRIENLVGCVLDETQLVSVVNGVALFMALDMDTKREFILRFDMADEVFTKIKSPHRRITRMLPVMCGEELVLLDQNHIWHPPTNAHVWVMKENNDCGATKESWTEVFTFDKRVKPLGFLKNGELVWRYTLDEEREDWNMCLYDPRLRSVRDINDWGVGSNAYGLFHYTESLILLNEGD